MGTFNFSSSYNTPYKAVFCLWEDHDAYVEDAKDEEDEENVVHDYSDWCDWEQDYYMECLKEDLKEKFGHQLTFNGLRRGEKHVAEIGNTFEFANMNFYIKVTIDYESGYYCGFALDWNIDQMLDCYNDEVPDFNTAYDYLRDGLNAGLATALAPKFIKRCEKELSDITDKIDDVLMHLAPHCQTIGWCCGEHKDEYKN